MICTAIFIITDKTNHILFITREYSNNLFSWDIQSNITIATVVRWSEGTINILLLIETDSTTVQRLRLTVCHALKETRPLVVIGWWPPTIIIDKMTSGWTNRRRGFHTVVSFSWRIVLHRVQHNNNTVHLPNAI